MSDQREIDPPAELLADYLLKVAERRGHELCVHWMKVFGERDRYRDSLSGHRGLIDTVVVVVRGEGFRNPNSLMADLANMIEANRGLFEDVFDRHGGRPPDKVGVLLLAKTELSIPQSSSPVIWPDWVPHVGGLEVSCHIEDISRELAAPLDSPFVEMSRVNRALHSLERALVRRLIAVSDVSPRSQDALYTCVGRPSDSAGWNGFLDNANTISRNAHPETFRPSVREGLFITSRLWGVASDRRNRPGPSLAESLGTAMEVRDADIPALWRPTIFSVLSRTTRAISLEGQNLRFLSDLVETVENACQLITSAHHAGDYPIYPLHLTRALVDELHTGLAMAEATVNRLPDVCY